MVVKVYDVLTGDPFKDDSKDDGKRYVGRLYVDVRLDYRDSLNEQRSKQGIELIKKTAFELTIDEENLS